MTGISTCPDEHELLPLVDGEPAGETIAQHLDACEGCRGRLERLRADLAALRDLGEGVAADPIGPVPADP
jgi:hypothetical protein